MLKDRKISVSCCQLAPEVSALIWPPLTPSSSSIRIGILRTICRFEFDSRLCLEWHHNHGLSLFLTRLKHELTVSAKRTKSISIDL